jgi:hypothetical protein
MARTVLNDSEIRGLILRILIPNSASEVIEWMDYLPDDKTNPSGSDVLRYKDLGFRDFRMQILRFDVVDKTVNSAQIIIWRKSRWFPNKAAEKTYRLILRSAMERYAGDCLKDLNKVEYSRKFRRGYLVGGEVEIELETSAEGMLNKEEGYGKYDCVHFTFWRRS